MRTVLQSGDNPKVQNGCMTNLFRTSLMPEMYECYGLLPKALHAEQKLIE